MNRIEIIEENICHVIIDNKPQNYLIKPEFISTQELKEKIQLHNCKAIIVSGAGRHFSAGADISTISKMQENNSLMEEMNAGKRLLDFMKSFNIPMVACIEGVCFGGGLELALAADMRIASEKSLFAFPETQINLIPGLSGTVKLPGVTGKAKALELILKGEIINSETALELGIIDEIQESKACLTKGIHFIKEITHNRSLKIINAVVEAIRNAERLPYEQAITRETELFCLLASNM